MPTAKSSAITRPLCPPSRPPTATSRPPRKARSVQVLNVLVRFDIESGIGGWRAVGASGSGGAGGRRGRTFDAAVEAPTTPPHGDTGFVVFSPHRKGPG